MEEAFEEQNKLPEFKLGKEIANPSFRRSSRDSISRVFLSGRSRMGKCDRVALDRVCFDRWQAGARVSRLLQSPAQCKCSFPHLFPGKGKHCIERGN